MITALGSLHTGRLVLCPRDPLQAPDQATLARTLDDIRLIGAQLPAVDAEQRYRIGPDFGSLIAFTGCAVSFGTQDAADTRGPGIRLPAPSAAPRLFVGRNTRPPRCPECRAPLRDWALAFGWATTQARQAKQDATVMLRCVGCGAGACAHRWDFGRHGGAGRSVVLIEEVFPGEASPLPALLRALETATGVPWAYFYQQD
jgi:hypothetical protein